MPPLKAGFIKRKATKDENAAKTFNTVNGTPIITEVNVETGSDDESFAANFGDQLNDSTDSEAEEPHTDSEIDSDEVLFDKDEHEISENDNDNDLPKSSEEDGDTSESEATSADSEDESESGIEANASYEEVEDEKSHGDKPEEDVAPSPEDQKVKAKAATEIDKIKKQVDNIKLKHNKSNVKDKSSKDKKKYTKKGKKSFDNNEILHEPSKKDEYASDSSDEEDRRNTVGDIPMWWYRDYPHIGYNLDGKKLLKPPQRDQIEEFLKRCEDPEFWRTIRDPQTGQDVILSQEDLDLIARIKSGQTPNKEHDEYAPWIEWFSSDVLKTPVRAFPEHKRSFLPSETEKKKISRLVHALKMGWIKTRRQEYEERKKKKEINFYNLWGSEDSEENKMRGIHKHIPAPRRPLPGHAESYNPPSEYLLDQLEMKQWRKLKKEPWKRKYTFLPQKFGSLREVPAYERYIRERFLRCLDLYLAPRAIKMRLTIDPQDLVPKLPSPRDLQPFPTTESLIFRGHADMVKSIDIDPTGQYLISGSDDGTVKVWEVSTGRSLKTFQIGGTIRTVAWVPVAGLSLFAVSSDDQLQFYNLGKGIGNHKISEKTDELLETPPPNVDNIQVDERIRTAVQWEEVSPKDWDDGMRIKIKHFKKLHHFNWHGRGDYICVTLEDGASRSVIVHQLSKRRSQLPFSKAKGLVECSVFHPIRPYLFVATQRVIRLYDLVKQELVKKLLSGSQWISTMAVHPAGDNLLVGTYDRKMLWFDLDLSTKPYQALRLHGKAVRAVAFHKRYPLFASAGDDRIIVSHGMVYNDLLQNPLIVPLKQLYGHEKIDDNFCILDVKFHPFQPWLFSAGADSTIRLYT